eukprot:RCo037402
MEEIDDKKRPREEENEGDEDDHKPEPISLEELRDKMREREKLLSKPTFMTKEQRQQLAIKKREEEAKRRLEKLSEIQKQRDTLFKSGDSRREERSSRDVTDKGKEPEAKEVSTEELQKIKVKYLGAPPVKKKVIKPSEKFKFTFAWETSEDTSQDTNPLYAKPYEAQLLFGRGFRAGIDSREQITKQIDYEEISKDHSKEVSTHEKEEQKRRERELAKERKEKEERERRRKRLEERQKELLKKVGEDAEEEEPDVSASSAVVGSAGK